jgi:hypothetical protein
MAAQVRTTAGLSRRQPRTWPFAGWSPGIAAENRAAATGRAALEARWAEAEPEDMGAFFTEADMAALGGSWSWLADMAGQAIQQGNEGYLEDTLAGVQPWGFPAGCHPRSGPHHARSERQDGPGGARTVFSRICTREPMRTRPWESPMIFTRRRSASLRR